MTTSLSSFNSNHNSSSCSVAASVCCNSNIIQSITSAKPDWHLFVLAFDVRSVLFFFLLVCCRLFIPFNSYYFRIRREMCNSVEEAVQLPVMNYLIFDEYLSKGNHCCRFELESIRFVEDGLIDGKCVPTKLCMNIMQKWILQDPLIHAHTHTHSHVCKHTITRTRA